MQRWRFTKMHGAGNDFVVLDATARPFDLTPEQLRRLGDRHFGVGADQILVVEPAHDSGLDFTYRIFNGASGAEVEHCGNGARCLAAFLRAKGLHGGDAVRVQTMNRRLSLTTTRSGARVAMGEPRFGAEAVGFDAEGLLCKRAGRMQIYSLPLSEAEPAAELALVSMGNPHAVMWLPDVHAADVASLGPRIERHARFAQGVNVGFAQRLSPTHIALRVHERDAGETLACGSGACAAAVAGMMQGGLESEVDVDVRGGRLQVEWSMQPQNPVHLSGPAEIVFEGEIEL